MSINIGSNFLYQGKRYLDDRQNRANTLEDLRQWNIPVPDGFEVCIDGSWYVFNSKNIDSEITGKFKKRSEITQEFGNDTEKTISQATVTEKFNEIDDNMIKLFSSVFPLEFKSITSDSNHEIGSTVIPKIYWTIGIKGEEGSIIPDKVTVNGSTEGVSSDLKSFIGSEIKKDLPETVSYKVYAEQGYLDVTKTVNFFFKYRKYYGSSPKESLESADILNLSGKGFVNGTSYSMSTTTFDCTGGKYPYYVIPKSIYKPTIEFWVGGLKNTDLIVKDVIVRTSTGLDIAYKTIRLNNIQTGKISIEIK